MKLERKVGAVKLSDTSTQRRKSLVAKREFRTLTACNYVETTCTPRAAVTRRECAVLLFSFFSNRAKVECFELCMRII